MSPRPPTTLVERRGLAHTAANSPTGAGIRRSAKSAPSVRGRRIAQSQDSGLTFRDRVNGARKAAHKVPFAAVVVALVVAGIGFTLFLSARSTEDTYALRAAQQYNAGLAEQKDQLLTAIEGERSAESLARKAHDLGMVSVISAPIIVRNPDGTTRVEGEEEAKLGDPVSPLQNVQPPAPGTPPAGDTAQRFGLPGAASTPAGGLSVPHQDGNSPVPDLGAGRRVDTPPAAPEVPAVPPPPENPPAPAAAVAPAGGHDPAALAAGAPADSPPHLAPAAPPAE